MKTTIMRNKKNTHTMTKFQEKVQKMEMRNRMMNPFRNEILFSDMGIENHLQNVSELIGFPSEQKSPTKDLNY